MKLTDDQLRALDLARDLARGQADARIMVLRGSAGTGKTTLVREIVRELKDRFDAVCLCAPTNKAARVIRQKSGHMAGTLHRLLYRLVQEDEAPTVIVKKSPEPDEQLLIIVDEASMISDRPSGRHDLFGGLQVLSDLIRYFNICPMGSRLIFVGDPCQLPPIGYGRYEAAPALDTNYLQEEKGLKICTTELRQTVRQAEDSYILRSATSLRDHMLYGRRSYRVDAQKLGGATPCVRKYMEHYQMDDDSRVMHIAWTNRDVNNWNYMIRDRLGLNRSPLLPGSKVMIDANWSDGKDLLTKGEIAHVFDVHGQAERFADLSFLPVTLLTIDEDGVVTREYKALALLEYLTSHRGELDPEQERHLRAEAFRNNPAFARSRRATDDPYLSALRLRYAYALTCHKAQGSEYENVIMHPYQPEDDLRWLYTAVTRARRELFAY